MPESDRARIFFGATVIVDGQYEVRSSRIFEVVDFLSAKPAAPQG